MYPLMQLPSIQTIFISIVKVLAEQQVISHYNASLFQPGNPGLPVVGSVAAVQIMG
jgi:hypothetical protein